MKKRSLLAIVMTVFMILSMIPSLVFAEGVPSGPLGGKLKVSGAVALGIKLGADYSKVTPAGITDDDVTFEWSRKDNADESTAPTLLTTEKNYTPVAEDLGYPLILKVTAIEERGVSGSLTVTTNPVAATEEEAKQYPSDDDEVPAEEIPVDVAPAEEVPAEEAPAQETPAEETPVDVAPAEEVPVDVAPAEEAPAEETYTEEPEISVEDIAWEDNSSSDSAEIPSEQEQVFVVDEDGQLIEESVETPETGATEPIQGTVASDYENNELDFGTMTAGAEQLPEALYVTLTNNTEQELHFETIAPEAFMAQDVENALPAGESVKLWIQPRAGLEVGSYSETIIYKTTENVEFTFTAKVEVAQAEETTDDGETPENPEDVIVPGETGSDETPETTPETTPEVTVEPEITETPAAEETPSPEPEVIKVQVTPETLDFGKAQEGYTEAPAAQAITITNTGNTTVTVKQPTAVSYTVGALDLTEIPAGGTAVFSVAPALGLPTGTYSENIYIYPEGEATEAASFAQAAVTFQVEAPKNPAMQVSPQSLAFGSSEAGYKEAPAAQTVTITNVGNTALTLQQPTANSFEIGAFTAATIAPGETSNFTVRPKTGLPVGSYTENITVTNAEGAAVSVSASFTVADKQVILSAVEAPAAITGIANGAPKTLEGLHLPSTVVIDTTNGKMNASVSWNVSGCAYDPTLTNSQTFTVNGGVSLPAGVKNPGNLALTTAVKVSVNGKQLIADPANNQITGISSDGTYTTETKISFTAVGAGMDNSKPTSGDIRYVPLKWNIMDDRTWDNAPYSATFRVGQAGTYTLKVTFNQQKFDGNAWVNTGAQDQKSVNFKVTGVATASPTPTPTGRRAVATGDNTVILPYIIVLLAAVICIAGILVYLKKRKNK